MFGRKSVQLVEVNFRELMDAPNINPGHGYVYTWALKESPQEGMRVWVPGSDGPSAAVICNPNATVPTGYTANTLKAVARKVTDSELEKARSKWTAERDAWADQVRRAAGLPTASRPRMRAPEGFPAIPPVPNRRKSKDADTNGRAWWAIYKRAEREGWSDVEVRRYKELAEQWFQIRNDK